MLGAEFPLAAGVRDPSACPSGKGDSELQRFPKATGTEGLQKTPEEEKQQHLSILKLPETHWKEKLFWANLSKIHKWRFLKAQEREKKKTRRNGELF